jgi:hypothetical protein
VLADPLDEHGHLVGDQARIGPGRRQNGQAAAGARGSDEEEPARSLS